MELQVILWRMVFIAQTISMSRSTFDEETVELVTKLDMERYPRHEKLELALRMKNRRVVRGDFVMIS